MVVTSLTYDLIVKWLYLSYNSVVVKSQGLKIMIKINIDSIVARINQDVAETELDGNIILLHVENGKYYNFNSTSSDLWRWLSVEVSVKSLVDSLFAKYDCSQEQAQEDVLAFLNEMNNNQLLIVK